MDQFIASNVSSKDTHDSSSVFSREAQILGGGIVEGLEKTASQTASGAAKFANDFVHNPLSATGSYIKDNWQSAVGGAAIAMVAPEGWFAKALVAYSLRGVATDTVKAAELGSNKNVSVSDARNWYSTSLAHEGTSFASSLPLALAGGYVGRVGADALLGKGNGLLDMIPRRTNGEWSAKVTPSDVGANIRTISDTVNPPSLKILYTDNDNTLIDFSTYFARGVEKAIPQMANKLDSMGHPIPEEDLWKSIGSQMDKARAHDYPWIVELALKDRLKVGQSDGMPVSTFNDQIVKPFWSTIDQSLHDNLKVMPTAVETLDQVGKQGITRVVVSDAPAPVALQRIVSAGINEHVDEVYALNNIQEPTGLSDELLEHGRQRVQDQLALASQVKHFEMVPKAWEKPNPNTFQMVMERHGVRPTESIMIDDSRTKGVQGAWNAGMRAVWAPGTPANAIWAEYGNPSPEIEGILERLRPLPEKEGAPGGTEPKKYIPPIETAKDYSAVLNHTNPKLDVAWITQRAVDGLKTRPPLTSTLAWNLWPTADSSQPLTTGADQTQHDDSK